MTTQTFDIMISDRESLLNEWAHIRAAMDVAFADLSAEELEEPGMTGAWNGRLTLAHIARWDETTTSMILRHHLGLLPGLNEFEDYEAWNLVWAEIDADITLEAAWQRYHSAHEAIVRTMRNLPDAAWDEYVRGWVREASLNHYRHHTETTNRWRAERESATT